MGKYAERLHRKSASKGHNLPTKEPKQRQCAQIRTGVELQRLVLVALFLIAGASGDQEVKTTAFGRLAGEGVLFQHAYVSSSIGRALRG